MEFSKHATISFPKCGPGPQFLVRQHLDGRHIEDIEADVLEKLRGSGVLERVEPGDRVGITAGSRGMGGFTSLLAALIMGVRQRGGEPFILPAMGSHGGATSSGQTEILHRLGVQEDEIGAEIKATMNTRVLGKSDSGAATHLDEIAADADHLIVLGRTKTHPENTEGIASGLLKMVTVGLGKQAGAKEAHSHGLWESVKSVPKLTLSKSPILCGVAVVENAFRQPLEIEIVAPTYEAFRESDERLLKAAQPHVAKLPFRQLDLLVVDELGKNISGTGMDLNVIGNWRMNGGDRDPDFRRIAVLSLTRESLGNGLGIGLADFTTRRFAEEFDWGTTYVNLLTATEPGAMNSLEGHLPLALECDREAIETALYSSLPSKAPRVCRIRNTGCLDQFWVSAALADELRDADGFSVESGPEPMPFDSRGDLL